MEYMHKLPIEIANQALSFMEFANGAAQATLQLKSGRIFKEALVSNATAIVALRGFNELPFSVSEIVTIYQSGEDKNSVRPEGWEYWDVW